MNEFQPGRFWRNAHLQSILPSIWPRSGLLARSRPLREASREWLLDCGEEVRLQAFHAAPAKPRDMAVVVLHGWEGSADAHYVLSLGQSLFEAGVEVVRLNLRDHGDTHHLNRDIFHSCRLPEVCGAVAAIQSRLPDRQIWLVGFSLGGNFMLRVAASGDARLRPLQGVVAVSPVLDPATAMDALESGWPLYQRYFVRKWTRSLQRKQQLWPQHLDFSGLLEATNLRRLTAALVARYTDFPTMEDYLAGYAITGGRLATLAAPAVILAAEDDPIIPAADLARLAAHPGLRIVRHRHGGHMGFMTTPGAPSWLDGFVRRQLSV